MRKFLRALLVIMLLAGLGIIFTRFNYLLMEKQIFNCAPGDLECLSKAEGCRKGCIPSKFAIDTGNLTLLVDITRGLNECTFREEVEQTGYTVNCTLPLGETGCEGSLYDYLVPPEDGGSGGGNGGGEPPVPPDWARPVLYCSLTNTSCKADAVNYVKNCLPATITDDDKRWASGYWTKYITVDRTDSHCELYFEIINAVDIPPEVPPNIVGMTMSCTIPLSTFPIDTVTEEWCEGPLFDYLEL